jgi:hypothetical protein
MVDESFDGWRKSSYSDADSNCVEVATGWRKSSYSDANAECVEVAAAAGRVVGVRDTRQKGHGPALEFPAPAWHSFIADLRFPR